MKYPEDHPQKTSHRPWRFPTSHGGTPSHPFIDGLSIKKKQNVFLGSRVLGTPHSISFSSFQLTHIIPFNVGKTIITIPQSSTF